MSAKQYQIVIIGGGTGGIMTAAQLKRANSNLDIVIIDPSDRHIYQPAWTLVGAGLMNLKDTIRNEKNYIPNGAPWMMTVGDVNNDGHIDVASANSNGNNVAILLGDGNGNLDEAIEYTSTGFPLAMDLGDIDGDGDLDMVSSNFVSVKYFVYENDGNGDFLEPIEYDAGSAASCTILHDRDNDGDLDMTGIDEVDDLIFLFLNDSTYVGINEQNESENFSIYNYPNPAFKETKIVLGKSNGNRVIEIFSVGGNLMDRIIIERNKTELILNTENYQEGIYFYDLLLDGKKIASQKMIIIN